MPPYIIIFSLVWEIRLTSILEFRDSRRMVLRNNFRQ